MGKRVGASGNGAAAKKQKLSPALAEIQDTIRKVDHLPVNCRTMLAAMVPKSFGTSPASRSEQQVTVIDWLEKALLTEHAKLAAETKVASDSLAQLEARKAEKLPDVEAAQTALQAKKELLIARKNALAEATIALSATKKGLSEKQEEQKVLDADYVAMKKEKEELAHAFRDHFKAPLDAGEALHYEELQPFLSGLDLEESFMVSVPEVCAKTKDERGSFDNVVLQALEQSLGERAAQILEAVSNRSPESLAREAAISKTEEQLAAEKEAQEKAATEVAAAQKDVELQTATVKQIQEDFDVFLSEFKAATDHRDQLQSVQDQFEQGPLMSFRTSKDGTSATELCATAGA